jgi:hypothetical protein
MDSDRASGGAIMAGWSDYTRIRLKRSSDRPRKARVWLTRYSTQIWDLPGLRRLADAEHPFELRLGNRVLNVRVRPEQSIAEDCEIVDLTSDGEVHRTNLAESFTYSGIVADAGEPNFIRLSIVADAVS